jgi:hypothetical protein
MKPEIREFKVGDGDNAFEGVLFYDADIINAETVESIIRTHGYEMNNKVFKQGAPCFFLTKAQADILRHSWVKQKVDNAVNCIVNYDINKELKGICDRMYGTNFEQDRIIIEDAIKELSKLKDYEEIDKSCMEEFGMSLNMTAVQYGSTRRHIDKNLNQLHEYCKLQEQGLIPKYHMGDDFWVIDPCERVLSAKVVMLQQKKDGTWKYRFCDTYSNTYDYKEDEFGLKFFATKEAAEKVVKTK